MNKSEIYAPLGTNTLCLLAHRNFELRTYVSGITGDQQRCLTFCELRTVTDYERKVSLVPRANA